MARTNRVLATPGGPSNSTWPLLNKAARPNSTASSWPNTTDSIAVRADLYSSSRDRGTARNLCESGRHVRRAGRRRLKKLIDGLERLPQVVGQERIAACEHRQQFVHIFTT